MKKRIKYVLVSIIAILFCFLYAHVDKTHNIYDANTDSSLYSMVILEKESFVSQSFKCVEKDLTGISIKLITNNVSKEGKLIYKLNDADGKEILKSKVALEELKSGRINKIKFDRKIQECKNNWYTISFSVSDLKPDENVQVYYDSHGEKKGELFIGEQSAEGTIILRTLTHRFDLETFIVTICFIIYFAVFFRILYKLFS